MLWSGSLSATGHKPLAISSPSGDLTVEFMLLAKGEPAYRVVYKESPLWKPPLWVSILKGLHR